MPRRISKEASNDGRFDELGVRVCARLPKGFPTSGEIYSFVWE